MQHIILGKSWFYHQDERPYFFLPGVPGNPTLEVIPLIDIEPDKAGILPANKFIVIRKNSQLLIKQGTDVTMRALAFIHIYLIEKAVLTFDSQQVNLLKVIRSERDLWLVSIFSPNGKLEIREIGTPPQVRMLDYTDSILSLNTYSLLRYTIMLDPDGGEIL